MLFSAAAGLASAGSHAPLSVVLWNDRAEDKTVGENFTVWAQVYLGPAPSNATNVTFRFGLGVYPPFAAFGAASYTGIAAGSTGLYRAVVNMSANDRLIGFSFLAVSVAKGNDTADNFRIVATTPLGPPAGGGGGGPWNVTAGVENVAQIGRSVHPGDTVVWRVDTYENGLHKNTTRLTLDLFADTEVDFTEAPTALNATNVADGVYLVNFTVPANLTQGRQYVLQATVTQPNFAQANASADVWFYDSVVAYTAHNATEVAGNLTVGDGAQALQGLAVNLSVVDAADPTRSIGWINGTTGPGGALAFQVANDGTEHLLVRGWVNGTRSQFVNGSILITGAYTPPAVDPTRFDAVPLDNISALAWDGPQNLRFAFYANGTPWTNSSVLAFVSTSRGVVNVTNLTTDANGTGTLSFDLSAHPAVIDDALNGGFNLTFRAAVGTDNRSSDRKWWGEDAEVAFPNATTSFVRMLYDTNLSFFTEPLRIGSPFGVGAKYTGVQNVTGWEGAAILAPYSVSRVFDGPTEAYDVWTGHGQPFINLLVDGDGHEYFGPVLVPPYWPNTTYTLLAVVAPSLSVIGGQNGLQGAVLNWTSLSPGQWREDFAASADTTAPVIFGPGDLSVPTGTPVNFTTRAYDNSLDFWSAGNYSWTFDNGSGPATLYGNGAAAVFAVPGTYTVTLNVTDGAGNSALHTFLVHALDHTPPTVVAGADFTASGGVLTWLNGSATDDDPGFPGNGTVAWSFQYNGSPVTLPGTHVNFTFWTLGTYKLTLTATDAAGNRANATLNLTVVSPDTVAPTVQAGPDRSVTAGVPVDFNGTATDNDPNFPLGARCLWWFVYNGTNRTVNASNFTFTFWALGTYTMHYDCTDFWQNFGEGVANVTVLSPDTVPPTVSAGADVTVPFGTSVAFNGTATDNDPAFPTGARFYWVFVYNGTPYNISGANFSFTFRASGAFVVTLWVRDAWGNLGQAARTVTVQPPDTTPPIIPVIPDQMIPAGTRAHFVAGATDDDPSFATTGRIVWTFTYNGATVRLTGDPQSYLFPSVGNYTITVTATDAGGNVATATFYLRVLPPDTTAPNVPPVSDMSLLLHATAHFSSGATDDDPTFATTGRITWTFTYNGSSVALSGDPQSFVFDVVGDYPVTLAVTDASGNGVSRSFVVHVVAPDSTAPAVTATATPLTVEVGAAVNFSGSAVDDGASVTDPGAFTWTFTYNGSVVTLSGLRPSFTFAKAGTYTVRLAVVDPSGNAGVGNVTITVTEKGGPQPPSTAGGSDLLLLVALLVAAAAVGAYLVMRRRPPSDEEGAAEAAVAPPAAAPASGAPPPDGKKES